MDKSLRAAAIFFLRIGQIKASERHQDECTLPIFPLPLIMDCEGVLSPECKELVERK